jgi:hypothetical protein
MGMLRQSLEVEILGMDSQMFESKQRDANLAFKVVQHMVRPPLKCIHEKLFWKLVCSVDRTMTTSDAQCCVCVMSQERTLGE